MCTFRFIRIIDFFFSSLKHCETAKLVKVHGFYFSTFRVKKTLLFANSYETYTCFVCKTIIFVFFFGEEEIAHFKMIFRIE